MAPGIRGEAQTGDISRVLAGVVENDMAPLAYTNNRDIRQAASCRGNRRFRAVVAPRPDLPCAWH
jgi:hypothetical protein